MNDDSARSGLKVSTDWFRTLLRNQDQQLYFCLGAGPGGALVFLAVGIAALVLPLQFGLYLVIWMMFAIPAMAVLSLLSIGLALRGLILGRAVDRRRVTVWLVLVGVAGALAWHGESGNGPEKWVPWEEAGTVAALAVAAGLGFYWYRRLLSDVT